MSDAKTRRIILNNEYVRIRYDNRNPKKPFELLAIQTCKCGGELRIGSFEHLHQAEALAVTIIKLRNG